MCKTLLLSAALASLTMASFSAKATENVDMDTQRVGKWSKWGNWELVADGVIEIRDRWIYVDPDGDCRSEIQIHNRTRTPVAVHCIFYNDTTGKSTDEWYVTVAPDGYGANSHSFRIKGDEHMTWHWDCSDVEKNVHGDYEAPENTGSYPRQNSLALASREFGRLERTLFMLQWLQSSALRRRVHPEIKTIFATAFS